MDRHGSAHGVGYRRNVQSEFVPGVGDLRLVGRGATASVFLGTMNDDGDRVAVKVLNVRLTDAADRTRFAQTLDGVAALSAERGIARVIDHGLTEGGHPWIVTEFLPNNLQDAIDRAGRLPWIEVAAIGAQIGDALAAAHRRGVLHGDLKPSDVRFDELRTVRVADFALARYAGVGGSTQQSAAARMAHCPPEVAAGRRVDERTDVYALASVLYEAIAGTPPFGRLADLGPVALVDRILTQPPSSLAAWGVPSTLDELLTSALAKDPSQRPATAALFADALAATTRSARAPGSGVRLTDARAGTNTASPSIGVAAPLAGRDGVAPDDPGSDDTGSDDTGFSSSPLGIDDIPFDELATPAEGYPIIEEFPVLDAVEAAPLLAAAGRRERRRRRERGVLTVGVGIAVAAAVALGTWWWVSNDGEASTSSTTVTSSVPPTDTYSPEPDALKPVGTITYAFTASFDSGRGEAVLSGLASPVGEARLRAVLQSVGRLDNQIDVQGGPEPDGGAAMDDAIILLASMRKALSAGTLRFDGLTFTVSGYSISPDAEADLRQVISLLRTPVARPDLQPDPGVPTPSATTAVQDPESVTIEVSVHPTTFAVPADGRLHVLPVTITPDGGSTELCFLSRVVSGGAEADLTMNYSSCGLARLVTIASSVPGTYLVTDTFVDERGTAGPRASVTFTVVVG